MTQKCTWSLPNDGLFSKEFELSSPVAQDVAARRLRAVDDEEFRVVVVAVTVLEDSLVRCVWFGHSFNVSESECLLTN